MRKTDTLTGKRTNNSLIKCSPHRKITYTAIVIGIIILICIGLIMFCKFNRVKKELESCRSI